MTVFNGCITGPGGRSALIEKEESEHGGGPKGARTPLIGWPRPQVQPRRYLKKLPLQANFYPMPVMAYLQDAQNRLTLHTAQALGVSSLHDGEWSRRCVCGGRGAEGKLEKPVPAPEACPLVGLSLSRSATGPVGDDRKAVACCCPLSPLPAAVGVTGGGGLLDPLQKQQALRGIVS